jgi:hypothetical protein
MVRYLMKTAETHGNNVTRSILIIEITITTI